eukprot:15462918-Alexandrium_andersonii.AAC.1
MGIVQGGSEQVPKGGSEGFRGGSEGSPGGSDRVPTVLAQRTSSRQRATPPCRLSGHPRQDGAFPLTGAEAADGQDLL